MLEVGRKHARRSERHDAVAREASTRHSDRLRSRDT
jgi:hypothetical protein